MCEKCGHNNPHPNQTCIEYLNQRLQRTQKFLERAQSQLFAAEEKVENMLASQGYRALIDKIGEPEDRLGSFVRLGNQVFFPSATMEIFGEKCEVSLIARSGDEAGFLARALRLGLLVFNEAEIYE